MIRYKRILIFLIFGIMLMPFTNQCFNYIYSIGLHGYYTNAEDTVFTWDGWFRESYQQKKGAFLNDHTGFRADLVRLSGQIDFSLFKDVNYGGASVTKDANIYYDDYVESYNGFDYLGHAPIVQYMVKVKALQDTLSKLGKTFLLVYAPNKAYYYKEHMSFRYKCYRPGPTNFSDFLKTGDSLGINQIDFNSWLAAMCGRTKDSIFTKQGIHWTIYSSLLAADSMVRYLERKRNIKMVHPTWTKVEHTTKGRFADNDMCDIVNLALPMQEEQFTYPVVEFKADSNTQKPKGIILGDSFSETMLFNQVAPNIFNDWQIWVKMRGVYDKSGRQLMDNPMDKIDWKKELGQTDCFILFSTTTNLPKFGWGFIDLAYDYYYPKQK
jgi:SGNH hydrolase-like domain, acetyltransferase AlgX